MGIILTIIALIMLMVGSGLIRSGNGFITDRIPGQVVLGMIGNLICGTIWTCTGFIILAVIWS